MSNFIHLKILGHTVRKIKEKYAAKEVINETEITGKQSANQITSLFRREKFPHGLIKFQKTEIQRKLFSFCMYQNRSLVHRNELHLPEEVITYQKKSTYCSNRFQHSLCKKFLAMVVEWSEAQLW